MELRRALGKPWRPAWWVGQRPWHTILVGGAVTAVGCGLAYWASVSTIGATTLSVTALVFGTVAPWLVLAPAGSAIARERELQTFDLLRATLLSEPSIVLGKLGACLAQLWFVVLTLLALLPSQVWQASSVDTSGFNPAVSLSYPYRFPPFFSYPTPYFSLQPMLFAWSLWQGIVSPWMHIISHTALGLLVSSLFRSSRLAVAASYAAVLAAGAALWVGWEVLLALQAWQLLGEGIVAMLLFLATPALVEAAGTVLLLSATVWRLKRL